MNFWNRLFVIAGATVFVGCSTLQGWLTPEGQKLAEAKALLAEGHPLGASARAAEAYVLAPSYTDAWDFLVAHHAEGQAEFAEGVARWAASDQPLRWDRLVQLYRWQQTLADLGPKLGVWAVAPVSVELKTAGRNAALAHLNRAYQLVDERPGPRQARKALAEVEIARGFAPDAPGLEETPWFTDLATQRLMVVPFFYDGEAPWGNLPEALGAEVSRALVASPLPPLTTVFPTSRLVTLPGAEKARQGRATQPEALDLAAAGGQNLVLLGQVTRLDYQPPRKSVRVEHRIRTANVVSPGHPDGVPRVWKATVTYEAWTTSVDLAVACSLVEVGGSDLATLVPSAHAEDATVTAAYTGDADALTPEDLTALGARSLVDPLVLRSQVVATLATRLADAVRAALP